MAGCVTVPNSLCAYFYSNSPLGVKLPSQPWHLISATHPHNSGLTALCLCKMSYCSSMHCSCGSEDTDRVTRGSLVWVPFPVLPCLSPGTVPSVFHADSLPWTLYRHLLIHLLLTYLPLPPRWSPARTPSPQTCDEYHAFYGHSPFLFQSMPG